MKGIIIETWIFSRSISNGMNRIIFQVVLVVVSVALFFTFIDPKYRYSDGTEWEKWGITRLKEEIAKYADAIGNANTLVDEREKLVRKSANIPEGDKNRLNRLLPDSIDNIRLIIDINNIAVPYGLIPKNIRLTGNDEKGAKRVYEYFRDSSTFKVSFAQGISGWHRL